MRFLSLRQLARSIDLLELLSFRRRRLRRTRSLLHWAGCLAGRVLLLLLAVGLHLLEEFLLLQVGVNSVAAENELLLGGSCRCGVSILGCHLWGLLDRCLIDAALQDLLALFLPLLHLLQDQLLLLLLLLDHCLHELLALILSVEARHCNVQLACDVRVVLRRVPV